MKQKITPFLWFDGKAEEAANVSSHNFSRFKNRDDNSLRRSRAGPNGSVMTVLFELNGQQFIALNGGPQFKFTEAVSFSVDCKTQDEVDADWAKLSVGGEERPSGWLKDKFGLSGLILPTVLVEVLGDADSVKSKRVMEAMMKMKKLDIKTLRKAYGESMVAALSFCPHWTVKAARTLSTGP